MSALLQVSGLGKRFGGFVALDGIDLDVATVAGGGGSDHGADRLRHTTALADDPTHVAGAHMHVEHGTTTTIVELDLDGVGQRHDELIDPRHVDEHVEDDVDGAPGALRAVGEGQRPAEGVRDPSVVERFVQGDDLVDDAHGTRPKIGTSSVSA